MIFIAAIVAGVVGIVIGVIIVTIANKNGLVTSTEKAKTVLEEANAKADTIIQQATLKGKQQVLEARQKAEAESNKQLEKFQQTENKLLRREDNLNFREENITNKEKKLDDKTKVVDNRLQEIDRMQIELQAKIDNQTAVLEKTANMSQEDAKSVLMDLVAKKSEKEIGEYLRDKEEEAEETSRVMSRNIIANAIQRYAQDEVIERTVSAITLPGEDMKGRIIGREGRNIKAIEQATGVDLIVDDTPDLITVSCFDPVRREVACQALKVLMKDGRIQPGRIEEVVDKVSKELDDNATKLGEETTFKLGIGRMNKELNKLLGRMQYRYSYGQNVLQHSIEVANFAGIMAAELGLNQTLAKRAGLLHDIGKAVDHEMEGSHVELGAKLAKKYGENPIVINAIESHHGDVPATDIISQLVAAADTLSAARPGARYESMENYIERLEQLEKIAKDFDGVEKAYAIQAGREIRVMVQPDKVDDVRMVKIAHDIKERIESEMTYPGQIRVTLIREVRAQELAQ